MVTRFVSSMRIWALSAGLGTRSSKLFGGCGARVVGLVDGTSGTLDKRVRLCRVRTVKLLGGGTLRLKNSGRQAAWRPGCSWMVSLEMVGGTSGSCCAQ